MYPRPVRRCPTCHSDLDEASQFCPYDGTPIAHLHATAPATDPMFGMLIDGRYRLAGALGKGGMAAVYRAHSIGLGEDVALKVLHRELVCSPSILARFARESRAAGRIDHPNVVRMIDFGFEAEHSFYFLVMELLEGRSLAAALEEDGPFELSRGVHVLAQIGAAMSAAHALGVLHRDLKPENAVLVSRPGAGELVKVVDFGLSRLSVTDEASLTRSGQLLGTPEFMAPERWRGGSMDERADVYAFGVTAFELLTGQLPFRSGPMPQLMYAHLTEPAPSLGDKRPGTPAPLVALVDRCLAKEPEDRFDSFDALLAELPAIWSSVPGPSVRVTYGRSPAAPSRAPDAFTELDASVLVHPDQAPLAVVELQRLRRLRERHLGELGAEIWGSASPPGVAALRAEIVEREAVLEQQAAELALAEVDLDAAEERMRAGDSDLRLQLVEASLRRAGVTFDLASEPTMPAAALGAVQNAESALAHFRRDRRLELDRLKFQLRRRVAELSALELGLAPLYEALAREVWDASIDRPELRAHLEAFGRVDGAIVAYQQLLERLVTKGQNV